MAVIVAAQSAAFTGGGSLACEKEDLVGVRQRKKGTAGGQGKSMSGIMTQIFFYPSWPLLAFLGPANLASNRKHGSHWLTAPLGSVLKEPALTRCLQSNHSAKALSKAVSHYVNTANYVSVYLL